MLVPLPTAFDQQSTTCGCSYLNSHFEQYRGLQVSGPTLMSVDTPGAYAHGLLHGQTIEACGQPTFYTDFITVATSVHELQGGFYRAAGQMLKAAADSLSTVQSQHVQGTECPHVLVVCACVCICSVCMCTDGCLLMRRVATSAVHCCGVRGLRVFAVEGMVLEKAASSTASNGTGGWRQISWL